MRKITYILGIFFLGIIIILNLIFNANLNVREHIEIHLNSFKYIIGIILLVALIYFFTEFINKYLYDYIDSKCKKILKITLFTGVLVIYLLLNIIWVSMVNPKVVGDSVHICNLAQEFYNKSGENLNNITYAGITLKQYMQAYPHQISLAFLFSVFFKIIHFDMMEVLRTLNIIGNILIVIALYKINNHICSEHKHNKVRLLTFILTFISLVMLSTFIYGDIPSLSLCLLYVYYMMKFVETRQIKYFIYASILSMISYMMRMNSLIFIIATVIYLLLNIFTTKGKKSWKGKLLNFLLIISYILISIIPNLLVKDYYVKKYNLDKNKKYPYISYFLMAMTESPRGNGWYNEDIANRALANPNSVKKEYLIKTKERVIFLSKNWRYTLKFYIKKIASTWAENTYSSIYNNSTNDKEVNLNDFYKLLSFYQKALLIVTCLCSLIVLVKNRKNLSLELVYLLTIFVGGFVFHVLWEAKSRYIIPYIIILIPIASINIDYCNIDKKYFTKLFFYKKTKR